MNKSFHAKKILVAPLDWGLGHATRCIVLIHYLKKLKCDITIAASGKIQDLLKDEFPEINFLNLPGYQISYSKNKRFLPLKVFIQIPKILRIIRYENKWLNAIQQSYCFDAIISDNRFGLYTATAKSIFITHQLQIKTNLSWLDKIICRYNYNFINRFNECWIPDLEKTLNLAGELSHPKKMPAIPVKYLGQLSRLKKENTEIKIYKWMVIISGPEPQRSLFEKIILKAAAKTSDNFLIVRGLPGTKGNSIQLPNCIVFNHLTTVEMQDAINASEFVISRCGYTTVMEVLALQKKSVLIPTPGQTEQEYLAKHLSAQNWCYTLTQKDDLEPHLQKAKAFNYKLPEINTEYYKEVLADFIEKL